MNFAGDASGVYRDWCIVHRSCHKHELMRQVKCWSHQVETSVDIVNLWLPSRVWLLWTVSNCASRRSCGYCEHYLSCGSCRLLLSLLTVSSCCSRHSCGYCGPRQFLAPVFRVVAVDRVKLWLPSLVWLLLTVSSCGCRRSCGYCGPYQVVAPVARVATTNWVKLWLPSFVWPLWTVSSCGSRRPCGYFRHCQVVAAHVEIICGTCGYSPSLKEIIRWKIVQRLLL